MHKADLGTSPEHHRCSAMVDIMASEMHRSHANSAFSMLLQLNGARRRDCLCFTCARAVRATTCPSSAASNPWSSRTCRSTVLIDAAWYSCSLSLYREHTPIAVFDGRPNAAEVLFLSRGVLSTSVQPFQPAPLLSMHMACQHKLRPRPLWRLQQVSDDTHEPRPCFRA